MSYRPTFKVWVCFCQCDKCVELTPFFGEEIRHGLRIALAKLTIVTRTEGCLMFKKGRPVPIRPH